MSDLSRLVLRQSVEVRKRRDAAAKERKEIERRRDFLKWRKFANNPRWSLKYGERR